MREVEFTSDLWLFVSPWCAEKLDDVRYNLAIARAWVALWNYTVDHTSMKTAQLLSVCRGLFDIPTNELIDVLSKRRVVFFPDDNRLIKSYRVVSSEEDFAIFVEFAEPNS